MPDSRGRTVRKLAIHLCPRCGTRVVDWRGEEPPTCGMHLPESVASELVEVVAVQDVLRLLEDYYHPQVHRVMHPADFITKALKLDGHEGLAYA